MSTRLPALLLALLATACTAPQGDDKEPLDTDLEDTGETAAPVDGDQDGYALADDCDDADATINPGATEVCDFEDNDCDGDIDESEAADALTWYGDTDGDGAGDAGDVVIACEQPATYLSTATDCDDADPANFPGNLELCDGSDNDCDSEIDEDDAADASTWYVDEDGDGYGDPDTSRMSCASPSGYTLDGTDCDDRDGTAWPGAPESCDGVDHDCNGAYNEDTAVDVRTWYADADADGYGNPDFTTDTCVVPSGYVSSATDCDDTDDATWPGAPETCDSADNDCDGTVDDGAGSSTWYADADGDGYGDASASVAACSQPSGYVADATDCDDTDSALASDCDTTFDGTFGTTWETLASSSTTPNALQSFHPAGTLLYNMNSSYGQAYDPDADTWTYLSTPAAYSRSWHQMAPWEGALYSIANGAVYRYTPSTDTWDTLAAVSGSDDANMTEVDEDGNLYGHTSNGYIVIYDTALGTLDYVYTGLGSQYETRMGYDATTRGLYFGAFYNASLYRYDLDSGAITAVTDIPEAQLNDIFCSDHAGHIYAAGDYEGTTMWQYTTATDTWSALPDLPSDHGNNSTCTVSEDGWLYVGTDDYAFYRLELY